MTINSTFTYVAPVITLPTKSNEIIFDDLKLIPEDDDFLKKEVSNFNFSNPPVDPIKLANMLVKFMIDNKALGLSANQLGLPYRCFSMIGDPNYVCFNPLLIGHGEEEQKELEGCLSFPDLFFKVKRWKSIKVRFTMPNGEATTKVFSGLTAKVPSSSLETLSNEFTSSIIF